MGGRLCATDGVVSRYRYRGLCRVQRALIRERQREGIAIAKQRGAYRGRKKSLSDDKVAELKQRVADGEQKAAIARDLGISRETLYQYFRLAA